MTITVAETFYMQLASNLVTTGLFHLYLSLGVMQHAYVQLVGREQLASDCFNWEFDCVIRVFLSFILYIRMPVRHLKSMGIQVGCIQPHSCMAIYANGTEGLTE